MSESRDDLIADYECPACGQALQAIPGPVARLVECGNCGAHFVVPSDQGSVDPPEDFGPSDEEKNANAANELNSLRMRHIIVTRRAAIRSRTYCIVGAALCLMGTAKLIIMIVTEVRVTGWHFLQYAYAIGVAASLFGAGILAKRAAWWQHESRAPLFPPDASSDQPPDFSTLSDGSQHARNLENL